MRFRNSSDYLGLGFSDQRAIPLNSATGKAFCVMEELARQPGTLVPTAGFSAPTNSAVAICSKVIRAWGSGAAGVSRL